MDTSSENNHNDNYVLQLQKEIETELKEGRLPCVSAEKLSRRKNLRLQEIGYVCNTLGIRIGWCQLGLFGHGSKGKILIKTIQPSPEMEKMIRRYLANGSIPCCSVWKIAAKLRLPRLYVAAMCEALNVKISPCQLGAF
ncbi:MAG: hypothetical protein N2317_00375 [Syntrophales bacterium]|nr:hypothetical protein [Syntrophales bacterium]